MCTAIALLLAVGLNTACAPPKVDEKEFAADVASCEQSAGLLPEPRAMFTESKQVNRNGPRHRELVDRLIKTFDKQATRRKMTRDERKALTAYIKGLFDRMELAVYENPEGGTAEEPECRKLRLRKDMLAEESVARGLSFLANHEATLSLIEEVYKVDRYTLTALTRIESNLGHYFGTRLVFNTLYTFYLYPARGMSREGAFRQLVAFITLTHEYQWDAFAFTGSRSGAMGYTQFMPVTFLAYGVDADGDGVRNPFTPADALASAANYLVIRGYKRGNLCAEREALEDYLGSGASKWRFYPDYTLEYRELLKKRVSENNNRPH